MANKANIERVQANDHPSMGMASDAVERASKVLEPFGYKSQGAIVMHYYRKPLSADFAFVGQIVGMSNVEEGQADVGFKELQKAIMAKYGREPKKERK